MNAAEWFAQQSFHQVAEPTRQPAVKSDTLVWSSWDGTCWRHYVRENGVITETDEIGCPL